MTTYHQKFWGKALDMVDHTRSLIEYGWTQEQDAVDSDGCAISCTHDNAVCWCLDGALKRAKIKKGGDSNHMTAILQELKDVVRVDYPTSLHAISFEDEYWYIGWNDHKDREARHVQDALTKVRGRIYAHIEEGKQA